MWKLACCHRHRYCFWAFYCCFLTFCFWWWQWLCCCCCLRLVLSSLFLDEKEFSTFVDYKFKEIFITFIRMTARNAVKCNVITLGHCACFSTSSYYQKQSYHFYLECRQPPVFRSHQFSESIVYTCVLELE